MKDKIKGLIIGLLIGISLVSTGVLATTGAIQKDLWYNNIKITLDGKTITPKDGNGNTVEPFTIDGTTYLPVRAISNALGLYVDWDANTNTVILSTSQSNQTETEQLVYSKDGIKISYKKYGYNEYENLQVDFLIENNSNQPITVEAADASVNGYMIYGSMYDKVQVGKKANGKLQFSKDKLKENGISKVESIEFCFDIMNSDTYKDIDKSSAVVISVSGASVKQNGNSVANNSNNTNQNSNNSTNINGYQCEHNIVVDKAVSATCEKTGLTQGRHCSKCGEIITKQTTTNKISHRYKNGECTMCGKEDVSYSPTFTNGDTWNYNDMWELTIDSVESHKLCNSVSNQSRGYTNEKVVIINYHYKNISFADEWNGNVRDLYISSPDFKVYDEKGEIGTYYGCTHQTQAKSISVGKKCTASIAYVIPNSSDEITIEVAHAFNDDNDKLKYGKATFKLLVD